MTKDFKTSSGFTLIELMIVLAIIAILAAVAIPSYQNSVQNSRRADAYTALLEVELRQEKHRVTNTAYAASLATLGLDGVSDDGHYNIVLSGVSATGYTVTANATGSQANDSGCTSLTLTLSAGSTARAPSQCWKH